jgi:hypothetical protein
MARLTLAEARTALAELLQLLDVEGSPELVGTINRSIAAAQRTLVMTERWMMPTTRTTWQMASGRTIYPSPPREGIAAVGVQTDPNLPPTYLQHGIALDDQPYTGGPGPLRWDNRLSLGVESVIVTNGGTGYTTGDVVTFGSPADGWAATGTVVASAGAITSVVVTDPGGGYASAPTAVPANGISAVLTPVMGSVEVILLAPPPMDAWTLVIDTRTVPPMSLADGDRLVLDELAVIYTAATWVAPSSGSPRAGTIGAEGQNYIKGLRGAGAAGTSFQPGSSARQGNGMIHRNGRWFTA